MNMNPLMKGNASVLALVLLLAGCAGLPSAVVKTPSVNLVDLRPTEVGLFEQHYSVKLRIQNPNPFALPIRGMYLNVSINDQDFAQAVSRETIDIPAFGDQVVDMDVISTLGKVVTLLQQSANVAKPIRYTLSGGLSVSGGMATIPFRYEGEISLGSTAP